MGAHKSVCKECFIEQVTLFAATYLQPSPVFGTLLLLPTEITSSLFALFCNLDTCVILVTLYCSMFYSLSL